MKIKFISKLLVLALIISSVPVKEIKADTRTISEPTELYGLSALLMDADSKEILFEKNAEKEMAIASTTKVLTCLIAIENSDLNEIVVISKNAASQPDVQMNAKEGEQYILHDLLKGMMLESYNDISVAVAEHIAGSEAAFADMMNKKTVEIGCTNSFFITANGLDSEENGIENHSTAKDLGLIMAEAISNEKFLEITQTKQWEIRELNGNRTVMATNKNRMLQEYDGMISGKTGYTSKAGYCYVGAAKRDDRTLIAITLTAGLPPNKNLKWTDTKNLLNYGFDNYHYKEIDFQGVTIPDSIPINNGINAQGDSIESIGIFVPKIDEMLLRDDETYIGKIYLYPEIDAPVNKNTVVGQIDLYRNEKKIGKKAITAIDDVYESSLWYQIYQKIRYFFDKIF